MVHHALLCLLHRTALHCYIMSVAWDRNCLCHRHYATMLVYKHTAFFMLQCTAYISLWCSTFNELRRWGVTRCCLRWREKSRRRCLVWRLTIWRQMEGVMTSLVVDLILMESWVVSPVWWVRHGTSRKAGCDTVLMRTMTSRVAHDGVMTLVVVNLIIRDSLRRRSCIWVRLGTCCDAGCDTVLMRTMTSCVVHDGVMTSLVVDLILTDRLDRRSCVMSAPWYLRECMLRHCWWGRWRGACP